VRRAALAAALGCVLAGGPAAGATRWKTCDLKVANRTPYRVLVHLDGVYWGWVSPQRSFTFKGVPAGKLLAYATTQYGEAFWGPIGFKCEGSASWDVTF
jgi:hypothetical protein